MAPRVLREALAKTGVDTTLAGSAPTLRGLAEAARYGARLGLEPRASRLGASATVSLTTSLGCGWAGQPHAADSHIGGLGDTIEEALAEAAATWASCMARPLLSALL